MIRLRLWILGKILERLCSILLASYQRKQISTWVITGVMIILIFSRRVIWPDLSLKTICRLLFENYCRGIMHSRETVRRFFVIIKIRVSCCLSRDDSNGGELNWCHRFQNEFFMDPWKNTSRICWVLYMRWQD